MEGIVPACPRVCRHTEKIRSLTPMHACFVLACRAWHCGGELRRRGTPREIGEERQTGRTTVSCLLYAQHTPKNKKNAKTNSILPFKVCTRNQQQGCAANTVKWCRQSTRTASSHENTATPWPVHNNQTSDGQRRAVIPQWTPSWRPGVTQHS